MANVARHKNSKSTKPLWEYITLCRLERLIWNPFGNLIFPVLSGTCAWVKPNGCTLIPGCTCTCTCHRTINCLPFTNIGLHCITLSVETLTNQLGTYMCASLVMLAIYPLKYMTPVSGAIRAQFHSSAKQKKMLTIKICWADFFGYQPNFHTKCMHFGW